MYQSYKYKCYGSYSLRSTTLWSNKVTLTVIEKLKPELTSDLKGAALTGNSVTLYCTLKLQSAGWKFYWSKDTQRRETETETHSYTIRSVNVSDGGQYWCRAGRGIPVYYIHYSDALWVNVTENLKPVVIIKPDHHVFRGETVTFRCDIQGGGDTEWQYNWYTNNSQLYHNTQEFSLNSVIHEDSGNYTCRGLRSSDTQISEISDAGTLTVSETAEAVVSVSPQSWLTEGDSVTLNCEIESSSTGWTFSWYTDVLYRDSQGSYRHRPELLSNSSRGSGGSYTLSPVTLNHTGVYMCRAVRGEQDYYSQYSKQQPLWITVSLIINPSRSQHFTSASLSLSCEDQTNSNGWTVRRYTQNETWFDCSSVSGFNISPLDISHTGVYWCQSESGECSNPVNITVHNGDVILDSPVHPATVGRSLTLHCLYRKTTNPASGVDFYKNYSVVQSKTAGEMFIHSVSKSDEVSGSGFGIDKVAVAVGVSSALLFIILLLIVLWYCWHKSSKGDAAAEPNAAVYAQVMKKDKPYKNKDDEDAEPGDVTYIELEHKPQNEASKNQDKPVLSVHTNSLKIFRGERVTLTCDIPGGSKTYNWYRDNVPVHRSDHYVYTINIEQNHKYRCYGSGNGWSTLLSNEVILSVIERPKAVVTLQPDEQIFSGEKVTFTCKIKGDGDTEWTYNWYKDDAQIFSEIVHMKYPFLARESNSGKYNCSEKPKPELTSDPKEAALTGNSVTLYCTLKLQSAGWKFYWSKDTQRRETETETHYHTIRSVSVSDGDPEPNIDKAVVAVGVGSALLFIILLLILLWWCWHKSRKGNAVAEPSGAIYAQVLKKNKPYHNKDEDAGPSDVTYIELEHKPQNKVRENQVLILLIRVGQAQANEPVLSVQPNSPQIFRGEKVTLTCTIPGGSKTYNWYRDDVPVHRSEHYVYIINIDQSHKYKCYGSNSELSSPVSNEVTLSVIERPKAVVTLQPDGQIFSGEEIVFTCEIRGHADTKWTYNWYKDDVLSNIENREYSFTARESDIEKPKPELTSDPKGAALTGNSVTLYCTLKLQSAGWKFYWSKDTQSRETETETHSYTIRSVSVSDGGQYRCKAGRGNPVYYTHYSDALWVNVTENLKPVVIIKPDNHVFRGETVTFRCEIQGGGDTEWQYSWYKNNNPLYHNTQEFSLNSVKHDNSGKYTCRGLSNNQRSEINNAVTLIVSENLKPVVIIKPDNHVFRGETVTFRCEIQGGGDTEWQYSWYKNNKPLYYKTQEFSLNSVIHDNSGKYTCRGLSNNQRSELNDAVTLIVSGWTFSWYTDVLYRDSQGSLRYRPELLSDSSRGSYTLSSVSLNHTGVYICRAVRGEQVYYSQYSKDQPLWITGEPPPMSLIINPSRSQHFTIDSLSLSCENQRDSNGWTVRGYTNYMTWFDCSSVSGCNISSLYTTHTGVYWCQSESGERSNPVNITVHYGGVILDSPVQPVIEGRPLTLRCLYKYHNTKISDTGVNFYKDNLIVQSKNTGEMTISSVSKSDEGFYYCKHPEGGESPKSWISVSYQRSGYNNKVVVAVGVSSALLFIILLLILLWCCWHKSIKGLIIIIIFTKLLII
ncbi:Fc receptor-like protein 5 [Silurus meridionalis]|nr:Fc receptor-like protein 5 [Silurus meridionalis]